MTVDIDLAEVENEELLKELNRRLGNKTITLWKIKDFLSSKLTVTKRDLALWVDSCGVKNENAN